MNSTFNFSRQGTDSVHPADHIDTQKSKAFFFFYKEILMEDGGTKNNLLVMLTIS